MRPAAVELDQQRGAGIERIDAHVEDDLADGVAAGEIETGIENLVGAQILGRQKGVGHVAGDGKAPDRVALVVRVGDRGIVGDGGAGADEPADVQRIGGLLLADVQRDGFGAVDIKLQVADEGFGGLHVLQRSAVEILQRNHARVGRAAALSGEKYLRIRLPRIPLTTTSSIVWRCLESARTRQPCQEQGQRLISLGFT